MTTEEDATRALEGVISERAAPGVAHVVVDAAGERFSGVAGVADVATGAAVTMDTMFMACSMTKALTAIAIMQLVARGEMELDAPLSRYYGAHPYGDGVTLRALLAHTSGVPNPAPLDWFYVEDEPRRGREPLERVLASATKLRSAPGARYGYSNVGYWLLGAALEEVHGRPYPEIVAEQILTPLGIAESDATFSLPPVERLARGHARKWSPMTAVFYLMTPKAYWEGAHEGWSRVARVEMHGPAYGGLFATPRALAAILRDLLQPEGVLLDAESRATMWRPEQTTAGKATGEALGWVVGELNGERYVGKQGGALGFFGDLRVYPGAGLASVYLANGTRVSPKPIDAICDRLDAPHLARAHS